MNKKYTKDDVIFWPDDPRLKNAVGGKCYYGDVPIWVLYDALMEAVYEEAILQKVDGENPEPFLVNDEHWPCIVLKKEEE